MASRYYRPSNKLDIEIDQWGKNARQKYLGVRLVILLFLLGIVSGLVNGAIQLTADAISVNLVRLLIDPVKTLLFIAIFVGLVVFAGWICKTYCRQATGDMDRYCCF